MIGIFEQFQKEFGVSRVKADEQLEKYTSIRIGGPAQYFFTASTQDDFVKSILWSQKIKMPLFILGGGTNTLFSDIGFTGLVIRNTTQGIRLAGVRGERGKDTVGRASTKRMVFLEVDSGVSVNRLVRYTIDQHLSGLEYFLGQPGTVGGAVYINAHNTHKNVFFGDCVIGAKLLTEKGKIIQVDQKYFQFGYDESSIQKSHDTILSVVIGLASVEKESLWEKAQGELRYRLETQPTGVFSSGCTFRNIPKSEAMRIATPNYTCSAGYLIDRVGLKGESSGHASFSSHHANFIVHKGEAKALDVLKLIDLARSKVKAKFGITLQTEIVIL